MKTKINKYLQLSIIIAVIILLNTFVLFSTTIGQYLIDDVEVPVFEGANAVTKFIYWDVGEINNQNNRLDLAVGLIQTGPQFNGTNYTHANWYKNSTNDNFNSEDTNTRIIYAQNIGNTINGLIFARLHTSLDFNKEIIITRGNGDLEVYWTVME